VARALAFSSYAQPELVSRHGRLAICIELGELELERVALLLHRLEQGQTVLLELVERGLPL
jgi:hypothetical protein